jgi:small redox-active disulfide protein 2
MLNVKVLGAGCANCKRLEQAVRRVAESNGLALDIDKVTDYEQIMTWNILQTPGLVVAGKLVAAGRIPGDAEILRLLTA